MKEDRVAMFAPKYAGYEYCKRCLVHETGESRTIRGGYRKGFRVSKEYTAGEDPPVVRRKMFL